MTYDVRESGIGFLPGLDPEVQTTLRTIRQAAGDPRAHYLAAQHYQSGAGTDKNPAAFRSSLQKSCDLGYMRERLNAPIEYDRDANGYRFGKPAAGPRYGLPGLWFSADEIHALLTMQHLLENTARVFKVGTALISIVTRDRQWFKSYFGIDGQLLTDRGTGRERAAGIDGHDLRDVTLAWGDSISTSMRFGALIRRRRSASQAGRASPLGVLKSGA